MIDKILKHKERLIFDNESSPTLIPYCLLAIESAIPSLEEEGLDISIKNIEDTINYDIINGPCNINYLCVYDNTTIGKDSDIQEAIKKLKEEIKKYK